MSGCVSWLSVGSTVTVVSRHLIPGTGPKQGLFSFLVLIHILIHLVDSVLIHSDFAIHFAIVASCLCSACVLKATALATPHSHTVQYGIMLYKQAAGRKADERTRRHTETPS